MKNKRTTLVLVLWLLTSAWSMGLAQDAAKKPTKPAPVAPKDPQAAASADVAAITAQSEAFVAAFNKGDAKAIAALWTPDGEYIDDAGRKFSGRQEIEKGYAEFFAGNPRAKIQVTIDSIKLLSADAAIEDGHAVSETPDAGASGSSKYTVTHVKVNGAWLMASVRDAATATPATVSSAADLQWLVGTWIAEDRGATIESVCSWVVDGRFLERKYTTTQVDGTKSTGVQLIGWNPLEGHVQSWNFSADGGHAVGTWMPEANGWVAQIHGTTGDGTPVTSINQLTRLDDNAYVWRSFGRTAGGATLPDTDEIVLKRQPSSH
jgi:uncharacterized protein (TIGR02246 family)